MKEKNLLKVALIGSLIGLVILYFISAKIEVKEYKPNLLNENIGDDVKLKGIVTRVTDAGNIIFIEVSQQSTVTVVLFTDDTDLKLKEGDNVEVIGEVQEYNGKNEVIAQRIRVLNNVS